MLMKTLQNFLMLGIILAFFVSCLEQEEITPTEFVNEPSKAAASAESSNSSVIDPINGGVEVGTAKLVRNDNGITMNLKTSGLIPGHAYTVWWVIWNNPENCGHGSPPCSGADFLNGKAVGVDVLFAAGHVAGGSGKGNFGSHLSEGDASGSIIELFGLGLEPLGLTDARKAEVHLVVRSHGPAIPGQVDDQINSFGGGCTTFLPGFSEIPDEVGECADIQFAIFLP